MTKDDRIPTDEAVMAVGVGAKDERRKEARDKKDKIEKKKKEKEKENGEEPRSRIRNKVYERELAKLQLELAKLQEWIRHQGLRVVVVFEGRDTAGKGGVIKRIVERLNPRVVRVAALPAPTKRERSQWYFQRYVAHLPAAGEMVLFDRSWYNRAGVERVMGYCTEEEYQEFLRACPEFEHMLIRDGIILIKYWFSVSDDEQQARFASRLGDPMRRWKLSPTDLESILRWEDYSRAKDAMFAATDTSESPWWTIESDDKRSARLNVIAHLLSSIPYQRLELDDVSIPDRPDANDYKRPPVEQFRYVPDIAARLLKTQTKRS